MVASNADRSNGVDNLRARLLEGIRREFKLTRRFTGLTEPDPEVLVAMGRVPRERFVPVSLQQRAYDNISLAIGCGQTISQPYIVALMSTLLRTRPDHVVLEIGTGSGYQAAVLSELVRRVYSIEIVPELAAGVEVDLRQLGYSNVTVTCGDGSSGWPEHAPFDRIIVTAAVEVVPEPLREQLAPGGRMVVPVTRGSPPQKLTLIEKDLGGSLHETPMIDVYFVPFIHPDGETPGPHTA